jgi:hypothetical protein
MPPAEDSSDGATGRRGTCQDLDKTEGRPGYLGAAPSRTTRGAPELNSGTRLFLRTVRGRVWLTETGGIVKFVLPNGRTLFRRSERRADKPVRRMLRLARRYRARIKRLYVYHFAAHTSAPSGGSPPAVRRLLTNAAAAASFEHSVRRPGGADSARGDALHPQGRQPADNFTAGGATPSRLLFSTDNASSSEIDRRAPRFVLGCRRGTRMAMARSLPGLRDQRARGRRVHTLARSRHPPRVRPVPPRPPAIILRR